ncbi:MAG: response regulator [Candidatus Omnitrophota bacterium]|nr:response regulator [Candidatus Omnitrophota bacterium]
MVDDEPVILETYKAILDQHFKVLTATSGREALEILDKAEVALIFLDINIPGMNGIEVLRKIKEQNKKIPVIMITATEDADILLKAKRLGIDNYIAKPFDLERLIALAHKAIQNRSLRKSPKVIAEGNFLEK